MSLNPTNSTQPNQKAPLLPVFTKPLVIQEKTSHFSELLKNSRAELFKSAREFCSQVKLGISYPQYARYEAGLQLPPLELALKLCSVLHIELREGIRCWVIDQIQDPELNEQAQAALAQGSKSDGAAPPPPKTDARLGQGVRLDDVIVFNRSHLRSFSRDPRYRDLFTFVNSFAGTEGMTLNTVAQAMEIPLAELTQLMTELDELGVVILKTPTGSTEQRVFAAKKNFYFPDDEDFYELRNKNLKHNFESILQNMSYASLAEKSAYRGLVTRELTPSQFQELSSVLEQSLMRTVKMPESPSAQDVFSICILAGKRFRLPRNT